MTPELPAVYQDLGLEAIPPVEGLNVSALTAADIYGAGQRANKNKQAFHELGTKSCGLICDISKRYEKIGQDEQALKELVDNVGRLGGLLDSIQQFVKKSTSRDWLKSLLNSKTDAQEIRNYLDRLGKLTKKFNNDKVANIGASQAAIGQKDEKGATRGTSTHGPVNVRPNVVSAQRTTQTSTENGVSTTTTIENINSGNKFIDSRVTSGNVISTFTNIYDDAQAIQKNPPLRPPQ